MFSIASIACCAILDLSLSFERLTLSFSAFLYDSPISLAIWLVKLLPPIPNILVPSTPPSLTTAISVVPPPTSAKIAVKLLEESEPTTLLATAKGSAATAIKSRASSFATRSIAPI